MSKAQEELLYLVLQSKASRPGVRGQEGHVPPTPSVGVSENFGNLRSVQIKAEFRHLRTGGQKFQFIITGSIITLTDYVKASHDF